ncbi:MAG: hypothetical protein KDC54_09975 [Lewinella sp.]|nr:hypothetical protein [Lewinella sp.]
MDFDHDRYKVYTWRNFMMLHWIINPGLAINELLLGQRVPRVSLEDKQSDRPRYERSFIPCPHCGTHHDSRTWSPQNGTAFRNWFGLYCPSCGEVIPCLTNVTSWLVLAATYPLWGWFRRPLRESWLRRQPARFAQLDLESVPDPFAGRGWIAQGLSWGLFMFVVMTFLFPPLIGDPITGRSILVGIPIWALGGLGFGYSMKWFMGRKGKTG